MADNFITSVTANEGEAPEHIMWMPAGKHTISATVDGKPGKYTVMATEACIDTMNKALDARKGNGSLKPVIFFDHKRGKAAAYPDRFAWGKNEDGKEGIMLHISKWTPTGKAMVEGGEYNGFSPAFIVDREGNPCGLPSTTAEIGSFTNEPAFRENAHIAACWNEEAKANPAYAEIAAAWQYEQTSDDSTEPNPEEENTQNMKDIATKMGLEPTATKAEVLAALNAVLEMKQDDGQHEIQAAYEEAESELKEVKAALEASNKRYSDMVERTSEAMIQAAIEEGRIPAQNEKLIATIKATFAADPEAGQVILASYKPQQDFHFDEKKKGKKGSMADDCQKEIDELK